MKRIILILIFLIGVMLGLYALLIEPKQIKVVSYEVATDNWGENKDLKIALITDVHAIWPWTTASDIEKIVRITNALKPDLILLLGDYVGTHPFGLQVEPQEGVEVYKELEAPCGVFAVLGNHDFDPPGWPDALRKTGIPVLENMSQKTKCDAGDFWVSGLEDKWQQDADVRRALESVTDNSPVIIAMHNPDSFVDVPKSVSLSVAGHMHRGQVRLPFIGAINAVLPSQYGKRYLYGHVEEEGKDLVVSAGLGMTGLPIRFMAPPEIAVITLVGAAD